MSFPSMSIRCRRPRRRAGRRRRRPARRRRTGPGRPAPAPWATGGRGHDERARWPAPRRHAEGARGRPVDGAATVSIARPGVSRVGKATGTMAALRPGGPAAGSGPGVPKARTPVATSSRPRRCGRWAARSSTRSSSGSAKRGERRQAPSAERRRRGAAMAGRRRAAGAGPERVHGAHGGEQRTGQRLIDPPGPGGRRAGRTRRAAGRPPG